MKTINTYKIIMITIISIFFISTSWASNPGRTFQLEATSAHPDANGTAVIDQNHVSIQARGLKSDSVYTVWFVNMKPRKDQTGAGSAPYMFQTDKWGNGSYSSPLMETPFDKWAMVMVVLHPNGNPKDMKRMIGALKAEL